MFKPNWQKTEEEKAELARKWDHRNDLPNMDDWAWYDAMQQLRDEQSFQVETN